MTPANQLGRAGSADETRVDAWVQLARASTDGVTSLLAALEDSNWSVRRELIAALGALGDEAVTPLCASLAQDRGSETRIAATVDALVASVADVEDTLVTLVDHDNPAIVADVAQILGRRRKTRAIPTLLKCLQHTDDNVAVAAIEALGRVGGRAAVDALVETVEREYFFRTYPAIDVLGRSRDPRAVAPLARLLHKAPYVAEAARALGRTADKSALGPLVELLLSPHDGDVRLAGLALVELLQTHHALYGTTPLVAEAVPRASAETALRRITVAIEDADVTERIALCLVLGELQLTAAGPVLSQQLSREGTVVAAAVKALERLGPAVDEDLQRALIQGDSALRQLLLPLLTRSVASDAVRVCLHDTEPLVRAAACDAIALMADTSAVSELFTLLDDGNARVVQAAMRAIQSLHCAETKPLALAAAQSTVPSERRAALRILSYFGFSDAIDIFNTALSDADPRVRDVAIAGLPFIEHPRAHALLLEIAKDPSPQVRTAAMRGLGHSVATPETVATLRNAAGDPEAWVRYYACQALGKLAIQAALPEISALLTDDAGHVRIAAIEALAQLRSPAALGVLIEAAHDDDPDLRRAALIGLGVMKNPEAVPTLLAASAAPEPAARQVALSALSVFNAEDTLAAVAHALGDADDTVRATAVGLLAAWPQTGGTLALLDAMGQAPPALQNSITDALATPAPGRIAAILTALANADDELAPLLVSLLARVDPEDRSGAVFEALRMNSVAARKAAAALLAARGTREALAALTRQASEDSSPEVRKVCALLLAQ